MKKIRKMDEMELMIELKVSRICHLVIMTFLTVFSILKGFNVFPNLNGMYIDYLLIIAYVTFIIAGIIYMPRKIKEKNEK